MTSTELNAPRYRYFTADLVTNTILAEIPFLDVSYGRAVKGAGSFSGSIPFIEATEYLDLYNSTMPGKTALFVVRNDVCVWGGIIWSRQYDLSSRSISVNGSEFTSYLYHRVIWKTINNRFGVLVDPVGSDVDIELQDGTFDFAAGQTLKLNFYNVDEWEYDGYYTVKSTPAPTTTTARLTKPDDVDAIAVRSAIITYKRLTSNRVVLTTDGSGHDFEAGEWVKVTNCASPFNGTFKVLATSDSIVATVVKRKRASNVATLTCLNAHNFVVGTVLTIANVDGTGYNGTVTVTAVPADNQFSYASVGTNEAEVAESTAPTGTATSFATFTYRVVNANVTQASVSGNASIKYSNATAALRTDTYHFIRDILDLVKGDFVSIDFPNGEIEPGDERAIVISSLQRTDNVTTVTTASRHNLVVGQKVHVYNVDATFDGKKTVASIPTATTFTYANSGSNTSVTPGTDTHNTVGRAFSTVTTTIQGTDYITAYGTLTTDTAHGYNVGDRVTVSNVDARSWRSRYFNTPITPKRYAVITAVPSSTTFTYKLFTRKKKLPNSEAAIVSKSLTNNIAYLTTSSAHGFKVGDSVTVSNVGTNFNGTYTITAVPNSTVFAYAKTAKNIATASTSGKVTLVSEVISRGTVTRIGEVRADSYGPYPLNTDIGIDVSPATEFSGTNKLPVDFRGFELSVVGDALNKYVTEIEAFDYRVDCDYVPVTVGDEETYLSLSGTSGSYASTPDSAALDILGTEGTKFLPLSNRTGEYASSPSDTAYNFTSADMDLIVCVKLQSFNAGGALLLSRPYSTGGWYFSTNASGALNFTFSLASAPSTLVTTQTANGAISLNTDTWVRVTRNTTTGDVLYYKSESSPTVVPTSWTSVATTSAPRPGGDLATNTNVLGIGGNSTAVNTFGSIYRAILKSNGSTIFDADFTAQSIGATSFTESTGKVVTINGSSSKIVDGTTFLSLHGTTTNYASAPDSTALDILGTEGTKFLAMFGFAGDRATTPSNAALDITGDVELVVRVALDDWTQTGAACLLGKNNSYTLQISATGYPYFQWYGTAGGAPQSTAVVPFADGQAGWLKVTWDADNGASGNTTRFYYAADQTAEPTSWTQLGSDVVTAGVGTIAVTATALEVGSINTGATRNSKGKFYRAIVRNGIGGTAVFNADFTAQTIGATSFTESTGKTVTLTGVAVKIVDDTTFLSLNGVTGSYASAPDSAALDITGDIEIVARVAAVDWTPSATNALISKLNASGSYSYELNLVTGGTLQLRWSSDGTTIVTRDSTIAIPATDGTTYWVKATLDVDNGAAGHDVKFYYAADSVTEPSSWTQLGTTVTTAGTTSIFSSTASLAIGSRTDTGSPTTGRFYRAIVRSGIAGTTVFDADFSRQIQFATTFYESTGKLVTVNGSGARIERSRNIELVARVALKDWSPAAAHAIIGKWKTTGNQRSYALYQNGTTLTLQTSSDGNNNVSDMAGASFSAAVDGATYWVKVTRVATTGVCTFYYAADQEAEPTSWTSLGSSTMTYKGGMFSGTGLLEVGSVADGTAWNTSGRVYRTIVRNGIGGTNVFDADFSRQIQFATTFYEQSTNGAIVTINGTSARIERNRDVEIIVRVSADDWSTGAEQGVIAKRDGSSASYIVRIGTTGRLEYVWFSSGLATVAQIIPTTPLVDGTVYWIRVTHDVHNGSGGNDVKFYVNSNSETVPTSWTQTGSTYTTAGFTSVDVVISSLYVGSGLGGTNQMLAGKVYYAAVKNGIGGTTVFDADFTEQLEGATSFTETLGATVTVAGSAQIARNAATSVSPVAGTFTKTLVLTPVEFPSPPAAGEVSPITRFGAEQIVFEYPGNIVSFSIDESAENAATRVFAIGDVGDLGADASQPYSAATAYDLLNDGWPILEIVEKKSDEYDEAKLFSTAKKILKQSRPPIGTFSIAVNGSIPPITGTYDPGEWCSIVVDDRFVLARLASDLEPRNTVIVRKIDAYSVEVPNDSALPEIVQLTLTPEWEVDKVGE